VEGKIIEVLAPPASGKSYFLKRLAGHLGPPWISSTELFSRNNLPPEYPVVESEELKAFYRSIFLELMRGWTDRRFTAGDFWGQIRSLRFCTMSMERNLFLDLRPDLHVLNDEGLVANFCQELLEIMHAGNLAFMKPLLKRRVILFRPPVEDFLTRVRYRRARGSAGPNYTWYSDQDLARYYENACEERAQLCEALRGSGVNVVELSGEETRDLDRACEKVARSLSPLGLGGHASDHRGLRD